MKKILFLTISFYLTFSSSFAQDWAPFKTSDTLKHYLSYYTANNENQIQSVVQDTSYADATTTVKIFKKGFSIASFYSNNIWSRKIKGQLLGDTAWINTDSSVFASIDTFGYRLVFPHYYFLNMQFSLGVSVESSLKASVDSIYADSVNGRIDSLVLLSITAFDSLNVRDTNHHFDGAELIISKNNGLFKTVDFTNRFGRVDAEQYFIGKAQFTERDKFELTVGDEYHYTLDTNYLFSYYRYQVRVISDTIVGFERTIKLEHKWRKVSNTIGVLKVDTFSMTFIDSMVLFNDYSLIIEEDLDPWQSKQIIVPEFSVCNYCSKNRMNRLYYRAAYHDVFALYNGEDSISIPSGLNGDITKLLIGVDYEYYRWGRGGSGWASEIKNIVYLKKGNQSWGTPLNLTVGLNESKLSSELDIFPNPTNDVININSSSEVSSIQVYNMQGQKVQELSPMNKKQLQLSLEGAIGIYFIQVQLKNGDVKTSKVVKQ